MKNPNNNSKLILIINSLVGGGAENVVVTLAEEMSRQGIEVHIISIRKSKRCSESSGIKFWFLSQTRSMSFFSKIFLIPFLVYKLHNIINRILDSCGKYLIISHLPYANLITLLGCKKRVYYCIHNTKSVQLNHGFANRARRLVVQWMYYNRNLIAVSKGVAKDLKEKLTICPKSLRVIYNPFDVEQISRLADKQDENITDEKYIIHVGSFSRQKRHDILLRAFKLIHNSHKLVLLGKGSLENDIKELTGKLGLHGRVKFAGWKENPYPWIKKASLLVLSSDFEGLSSVLIEALICGTPVVSTDCPSGPKEILRGALAKHLVPVGDVEKLAEKIDAALDEKIEIDQSVYEPFSADNVFAEYVDLFDKD
ncbi:MAG: glycosyltransferase [Planctomycetota bacterium]|jgi:glycosyltransferase involved in cell wall biosynthesis